MIAALTGLWRYGLVLGLLAGLGIWHLADKSRAVDDAVELVRAEYITAALVASESARSREKQLQTQVQEAKNAAITREKTLLADADRSRLAADRLRDDLATARVILPGLTRAAVDLYADTATVVLNECINEYRSLAAQTDALANDRQTLIDAWPR
ncbi:MAG: hypothetical protein Q7U05_00965 [Polaromonas sp.]|nr:hypothetical protein [Polaromonas sp.]